MKYFRRITLISLLIYTYASLALETTLLLNQATAVLQNVIASDKIPINTWQNTTMLAIIPKMEKIPVGIGGTLGTGIVVTRVKQQWSPPLFVSMVTGNLDFPENAKFSDILVIFKNSKTSNLNEGKMSVDASLVTVYAYTNTAVTEIPLNTPVELELDRTLFANFYGNDVNVADVVANKVTLNLNDVVQLKTVLATLAKKP